MRTNFIPQYSRHTRISSQKGKKKRPYTTDTYKGGNTSSWWEEVWISEGITWLNAAIVEYEWSPCSLAWNMWNWNDVTKYVVLLLSFLVQQRSTTYVVLVLITWIERAWFIIHMNKAHFVFGVTQLMELEKQNVKWNANVFLFGNYKFLLLLIKMSLFAFFV